MAAMGILFASDLLKLLDITEATGQNDLLHISQIVYEKSTTTIPDLFLF